MSNKKHDLATEKGTWSYHFHVTKTNCKDKVKGHIFVPVEDKDVLEAIKKEHPTFEIWLLFGNAQNVKK